MFSFLFTLRVVGPQVSGDDGKSWAQATGAKVSGLSVAVQSSVSSPTHIRYAYSDFVDCVVSNVYGLPSGPAVVRVDAAEPAGVVMPPTASVQGPATVAATPPMGMNSWNSVHT